ncbi:Nramp family divalent metal transporter [Sphingomonas crusticola]|uniref:Nramp family divalent metal transporter n=1 Tax=Sphingomonas crusticola TaxID=1697973 RepID=UPI001F083DE8|nr:Nramp family divalent metal transporter [Sphingomonas crusticola]
MTPPPPPPASLALEQPAPHVGSLGTAYASVPVPRRGSFWRKLGAFMGPGYLIAVGYMDPGNWATDLAGGSRYGYSLLWVIVASNLMAMLLQALSAKLGIVAGRDLAQACREHYSPPVRILLWLLAEVAIIACDLAEVIGTAVALQLLFGIPMPLGVCLTGVNVAIAMLLERRGFRKLEALIAGLMVVVAVSLGIELILSRPDMAAIAGGLVPSAGMIHDPAMLFIAAGIIGATVMPHNLYLHSAVVQTRQLSGSLSSKREAVFFATLDSVLALSLAMLVNAAILLLAASVFHPRGQPVEDIAQAYHLLSPMLGVSAASLLFAIALLASGQNSTLTGTMAGQVVMEGFTNLRMPVWARRSLSRALAIVPAAIVAAMFGNSGTAKLLLASQVVLTVQLPFAIVPLIRLTGSRAVMGEFANRRWVQWSAWIIATLIAGVGLKLLFDLARSTLVG